MLAEVNLKPRLLRVGHRAQVASVGLDISMVHEVRLQVALGNEGVVAVWVQAFIWTVISL